MVEELVFMDTDEAAAFIKRTPKAIRNLVARRKIPFRKPGGRLVFLREELEQWIQSAPGITIEQVRGGRCHRT